MPIVAKLFSSFCVSVFLVMLKDCGLVFHQSDSVLIFGWNYLHSIDLLNLFFFFFQEKRVPEVVLKAMGQAISKTVAIAEIIKVGCRICSYHLFYVLEI